MPNTKNTQIFTIGEEVWLTDKVGQFLITMGTCPCCNGKGFVDDPFVGNRMMKCKGIGDYHCSGGTSVLYNSRTNTFKPIKVTVVDIYTKVKEMYPYYKVANDTEFLFDKEDELVPCADLFPTYEACSEACEARNDEILEQFKRRWIEKEVSVSDLKELRF